MAEMRVVVQLSDAEYERLLEDVTDVFENEANAGERTRKLRMLLQYRGYMTSGYEEKWSIPDAESAPRRTASKAGKKTKKAKKVVKRARRS